MKKSIVFCMIVSAALSVSALPTIIDTVLVPTPILRYEGTTTINGNQAFVFSGKVTYQLRIGDADSLHASLSFVPSTGTEVIPAEINGDAGSIDWASGSKTIFFKVKIVGTPAESYRARITLNAELSAREKRVNELLSQMTQTEKCNQLHGDGNFSTPGVLRLNVPGFDMADGPHGVRWRNATLFCTGAATANTWDTTLTFRMGVAKGKECRGKGRYVLLGPMINMVRDPRGGRNFETYSEDPYLTSILSIADIQGIQSVGTIACPKHLVCNDRENNRDQYSSDVGERTLREIYAMPFEYSVKQGKAWSVMTCYNKVNGTYASENKKLLTDLLRTEWGFIGFEMSDWGATHSAAEAANAGHDVAMDGGTPYESGLNSAVSSGQVSQATLDALVKRTLRAKIWAGVLDEPILKFESSINCPEHKALTLEAGRKSIVLAKNDNNTLPLPKTISKVAVVGEFAATARLGGGGSSLVTPYYSVSPMQGIQNKIGADKVTTDMNAADAIIVFVGVDGETEGGDRTSLALPAAQNTQVQQALNTGKKTIVVFTGGSAAVAGTWSTAPAVIIAFYPGQEQGNAIADVLFGDYNPGGKLAVTFPNAETQLPPFTIDNLHIAYEAPGEGRGYRYFDRKNLTPLFCFGHGLSYTTFTCENLAVTPSAAYVGDRIRVSVDITNTGTRSGDEIPQLYIRDIKNSSAKRPVKELKGFSRVALAAGQKTTVTFTLYERDFAWFDDAANRFVVDPGDFEIMVGTSSKNIVLRKTITLNAAR